MAGTVPTPTPPEAMAAPVEPAPPADNGGQEQEQQTTRRRRGRPRSDPESPPPFKPKVTSLHVNAVRKVRTGEYESLELMMHLEAEPDPTVTVRVNLQKLGGLVVQEATAIAERVGREIEISRG